MTEKKFSNARYGARRLLEKRRRILKAIRVDRKEISKILEHDEENIVKISELADPDVKKALMKIRTDQRKALEDMKGKLVELERLESEIGRYGFNINDSFNGIETSMTLIPAGTAVA